MSAVIITKRSVTMSSKNRRATTQPDEDPLLTSADVARLFNTARSTVWRWVAEGKIQSVKFPSGLRRVRLSDVQRVLGDLAKGPE